MPAHHRAVKATRNPDYWKPNRPYLDGIEYTIIADASTAKLAFESGKFDMTLPYDLTVPVYNDVRHQMPQAVCELSPGMIPRHLLVNRDKPPFIGTVTAVPRSTK
jgi:peptide/nickel transport system substrate-binding protein